MSNLLSLRSIRYVKTCVCLYLAFFYSSTAFPNTLHFPQITGDTGKYAEGLIRMVLANAEIPYTYTYATSGSNTPRELEKLEKGELSVFWSATSNSYEEQFRPVRIPLYRGLMGYRILLIRKGEQHRFNHIKSLKDISDFSLGQGRYWTDTEILEANGLNIVKALHYGGLFHMLDGGRFDIFPRAINEPWGEVESRPELALAVEENIALAYKMPYYIFLNKNNDKLANDLEAGFREALENGSFQSYFFNDPKVGAVIKKANLENRVFIELINPHLSPETPLDQEELWLDIKDLKSQSQSLSSSNELVFGG